MRRLAWAIAGPALLTIVIGALGLGAWAGARPVDAAYPGQNGLIVFNSNRDGVDFEIYTMNSDGTSVTRRTFDNTLATTPRWSPDGTKIAFASYRDGATTGGTSEIYVMNADGSNIVRLTNNTAIDCCLTWSPDGSKIAFTSSPDDNVDVYVMNADGTDQVRLTTDPGQDDSPAWSSDGTKILFRSDRSTGFNELWVMNADGTDQHSLISGTPSFDGLDWKPDGSKIAFSRGGVIWAVDAAGSGLTQLTPYSESLGDTMPVWSPDGTMIAFIRVDFIADSNDVYVMNADGSGVTNITNDAAIDGWPDWQPLPADSQLGIDHDGGAADINAGPLSLPAGTSGTIGVVAETPPEGLGAWTVDIHYDPAVLQPLSCTTTPAAQGVCNIAFSVIEVRFVGATAAGLFGTVNLADIEFQAVGAAGDCSDLAPEVVNWIDPDYHPHGVSTSNGSICVTEPPEPCADVTGDGRVTFRDVLAIAIRMLLRRYDPRFDVNGDGVIDRLDLRIAIQQLGTTC
jgi:Tol biopolymer transport system component